MKETISTMIAVLTATLLTASNAMAMSPYWQCRDTFDDLVTEERIINQFTKDLENIRNSRDKLEGQKSALYRKYDLSVSGENTKASLLQTELSTATAACPIYDRKNANCRNIPKIQRKIDSTALKLEKLALQRDGKIARLQPRIDKFNLKLSEQQSAINEEEAIADDLAISVDYCKSRYPNFPYVVYAY